eukprot:COSAG02_NODE_44308_length_367_cov_0.962687_1_plen_56_part_10
MVYSIQIVETIQAITPVETGIHYLAVGPHSHPVDYYARVSSHQSRGRRDLDADGSP